MSNRAPPPLRLVVVLGAPNSPEGVLSEIARSRALLAATVFREKVVAHRTEQTTPEEETISAVVPPPRLVLTGGFGSHFNTHSTLPHAHFVRQFLLHLPPGSDSGGDVPTAGQKVEPINKADIFPQLVLSAHSGDDATLTVPIVKSLMSRGPDRVGNGSSSSASDYAQDVELTVVTSDFHTERASLVWRNVFGEHGIPLVEPTGASGGASVQQPQVRLEFRGADSTQCLSPDELERRRNHEAVAIKRYQETGR
jgi:hypothetical protein